MAAWLAESRGHLLALSQEMTGTCAVVLGMHRSGTSALAGVLHLLGVNFGEDLIGPSESNARGHFELTAAVALNDRILRAFRSRWKRSFRLPADWREGVAKDLLAFQREFTPPPGLVWGLKDPRICRLVPVWREILRERGAEPRFLICLRHPDEVAASLVRRDGMDRERALALWVEHVCAAVADTEAASRMLLSFDRILSSPEETAREIARFLDLPEPVAETLGRVREFLEPSLRHERQGAPPTGLAGRIHELACIGDISALEALAADVVALQRFREDCVRTEAPPSRWGFRR